MVPSAYGRRRRADHARSRRPIAAALAAATLVSSSSYALIGCEMFSLRHLPDRRRRLVERLRLASRPAGIRAALKQSGYALELLLDRRLWLFVIADAVLYLNGLFIALVGTGEMMTIYYRTFLVPCLLLELPVLAGTVALERRAGSLDLALAVPSTERYFARRVVPVCGFFFVQGWLALIPGWLLLGERGGWDLVRAMLQSLVISVLLGTVALFWAVRLKTSGGVFMASLITTFCLLPWILSTPFLSRAQDWNRLAGSRQGVLIWIWSMTVLTLSAVIFYLYARERLRRPETMLA